MVIKIEGREKLEAGHTVEKEEVEGDFNQVEKRKEFMKHTIEGLWKMKDASDQYLTGILEEQKKEKDFMKGQNEAEL